MDVLEVRSEIVDLVKNVAREQGLASCVITEVKLNAKGEGFLGQIFTITIKDRSSEKLLDIIVKAAFTDDKIRKMASMRKCFENEIYFYSEMYPVFKKIAQNNATAINVQFLPKCYQVSMEIGNEMLCLENLKVQNFEVYDKRSILDDEHIGLIFKTYGRFHAHSFVLRAKQPEEYSKIVSRFHNMYEELTKEPDSVFRYELLEHGRLIPTSLIPGEDDEIIKKFEKYAGDGFLNVFADTLKEPRDYSVILHGDCWSNNMMFKYEITEFGRKLTDMRLLDLQFVRVGSPVCDLSYCFYSGASTADFNHLDKYLRIYYDSFSSFLTEMGADLQEVFPFETLKQHWKKYAMFGVCMAFLVLKLKATEQEDIIDFTDEFDESDVGEVIANLKFNQDDYKKNVRGLIYHLNEIDVL